MAAGIYYAVNHGAQVISCSAALPATELPLADAVRYAFKNNVVVCSSAGNISRVQLGLRLEDMIYKAMDKEVILVGGVEKAEGHILPWPVTVPNPLIDVSAPSADVFIVVPVYMKELKNMPVAGTSLSAPIAAGVAALMRSFAPPAESLLKTPGGYVRLISRCLRETARLDVLGLSEPDEFVGRGLIDADAAVQMIQRLMNEKK
jgi:thermitase